MKVDFARLRRFTPVAVFAVTVGVGWILLASPSAADRARTNDRIALLQQREAALQAMVTEPLPPIGSTDPVAEFDTRIAADDPTASVVERLARLASDTHARGLFIETVEGPGASGRGVPPVDARYQPDPRFALFDRQLTYTTISVSFESDYAGLGRFLWDLRNFPSIVEVRTLNIRPRGSSSSAPKDGTVRTSMTLFAYSRTSLTGTSRTVTP
jgi:hypothetical protein